MSGRRSLRWRCARSVRRCSGAGCKVRGSSRRHRPPRRRRSARRRTPRPSRASAALPGGRRRPPPRLRSTSRSFPAGPKHRIDGCLWLCLLADILLKLSSPFPQSRGPVVLMASGVVAPLRLLSVNGLAKGGEGGAVILTVYFRYSCFDRCSFSDSNPAACAVNALFVSLKLLGFIKLCLSSEQRMLTYLLSPAEAALLFCRSLRHIR